MGREITEKEFAVIKEISNNHKPTQRFIAQRIGISLGLTNLIIKRLIKRGYIKIQEAPPRTIIYSLTPKGLAEKANKSYQYTLKTINLIKTIKENIFDIINREYKLGARHFVIAGSGELGIITEIAFHDISLEGISYSRSEAKSSEDKLYCYLLVKNKGNERKIDILAELSARGVY